MEIEWDNRDEIREEIELFILSYFILQLVFFHTDYIY